MNIFELLLDKTLDERQLAGKETFIRTETVDSFPFEVWLMNKKHGKTPGRLPKNFSHSPKEEATGRWIRIIVQKPEAILAK